MEANHHTEFHDIQCDKRNSYRRKVKAEKSAVGPSNLNSEDVDDSMMSSGMADAADANGGLRDGEIEPPSKRARREPGDGVEDDGDEDDEVVADDEAGQDEEVDEEVEEEDGDGDDDGSDGASEEGQEEEELEDERRGDGMVDEALDEPDSD